MSSALLADRYCKQIAGTIYKIIEHTDRHYLTSRYHRLQVVNQGGRAITRILIDSS